MRTILLMLVILAWTPITSANEGLNLEKYSGNVVLVDFWASWCVPCRRSFPWLNKMHSRYEDDGLVILAVNLDKNKEDAQQFLEEYPAVFNVIYDPAADLAKQYEILGMPSSIIFGRDGQVLDQHAGFKVKLQDEYETKLKTALEQERTK